MSLHSRGERQSGKGYFNSTRTMKQNKLSAEDLRELVVYDKNTGAFRRLIKGRVGSPYTVDGYIRLRIDGVSFRAHRLAWLYVTGDWPSNQIDHINGNRADNRFENLRDVTTKQNTMNQREAHKNNKSGLLGVRVRSDGSGFYASIKIDGKARYLGSFKDALAAHDAYVTAKREYHQTCSI